MSPVKPSAFSMGAFLQQSKVLNPYHNKKSFRANAPSKDGTFHGEGDSVCVTEENRFGFDNNINPIELADLEWDSQYKLPKIVR